jgi:hypothetical protein
MPPIRFNQEKDLAHGLIVNLCFADSLPAGGKSGSRNGMKSITGDDTP